MRKLLVLSLLLPAVAAPPGRAAGPPSLGPVLAGGGTVVVPLSGAGDVGWVRLLAGKDDAVRLVAAAEDDACFVDARLHDVDAGGRVVASGDERDSLFVGQLVASLTRGHRYALRLEAPCAARVPVRDTWAEPGLLVTADVRTAGCDAARRRVAAVRRARRQRALRLRRAHRVARQACARPSFDAVLGRFA